MYWYITKNTLKSCQWKSCLCSTIAAFKQKHGQFIVNQLWNIRKLNLKFCQYTIPFLPSFCQSFEAYFSAVTCYRTINSKNKSKWQKASIWKVSVSASVICNYSGCCLFWGPAHNDFLFFFFFFNIGKAAAAPCSSCISSSMVELWGENVLLCLCIFSFCSLSSFV